MTPRQFYFHGKAHAMREKRHLRAFQFLATVTARCAGNDSADFMVDHPEETTPEEAADRLEAFLRARAVIDGASDRNQNGGSEGTQQPHTEG